MARAFPRGAYVAALVFLFVAPWPGSGDEAKSKAAVYALYARMSRKFPDVADVHPLVALQWAQAGKAVFVDVRPDKERSVSSMAQAVAAADFEKNPGLYAGREVVAFCTIGYRSALWARKMARKGVPVKNLAAGLLGWVWEGGKLVDAAGETSKLDVYSKKFNILPPGFEGVW